MQSKVLARSMASGSVAYALDEIDQSDQSRVVLTWVAYENDPLEISQHAVRLRKSTEETDWVLCFVGNETLMLRREQFFPMLVGKDRFWQMKAWGSPATTSKQIELLNKLFATFETDPLEDGMNHPAEQIIKKTLQSSEDRQVFDWFKNFSLDTERPSFAASILRCLGRQTNPGTYSWRAELVRRGLAVDNVEIRDATVQAAESWGDQELVSILISHHETEPWLRQYISDVVDDLGE